MARRGRRKNRRSGGLTRKIFVLAVALAVLWGVGFLAFLNEIPRENAADVANGKADAIVVLTGGGGRLDMGLDLLVHENAAILFVSGVDPEVDKAALLANRRVAPTTADCCIVLGHAAGDTFGNASETARWIEQQGFTSLYIVTANYHMPRSLVEFRAVLPQVRFLPRAVHPDNVHLDDWWRWPGTIKLLAAEYTKYVAARVRTFVAAQLPV